MILKFNLGVGPMARVGRNNSKRHGNNNLSGLSNCEAFYINRIVCPQEFQECQQVLHLGVPSYLKLSLCV